MPEIDEELRKMLEQLQFKSMHYSDMCKEDGLPAIDIFAALTAIKAWIEKNYERRKG